MACTVAVEEVIDEHYAGQQEALESDQAALKDTIETFRQEELEHRDIGLQHGAEEAPAYELLSGAVKAGSRLAIWLSRSEEHTSELQSLMRISYAVFCLKKKNYQVIYLQFLSTQPLNQ